MKTTEDYERADYYRLQNLYKDLVDEHRVAEEQLAEARAEIERLRAINKNLDAAIAEMTEEQAALCAEDQSVTELVAGLRAEIERRKADYAEMNEERIKWLCDNMKQEKLIKQMREALRAALTEARSTECERLIEAALSAAERGE